MNRLIAVLCIFTAYMYPSNGESCSRKMGAKIPTITEAFAKTPFVFQGIVSKVDHIKHRDNPRILLTMKISNMIKGAAKKEIIVNASALINSCDYIYSRITEGEECFLSLNNEMELINRTQYDGLQSRCSGTTLESKASYKKMLDEVHKELKLN